MHKLIIIRGNSGSGKTSVAKIMSRLVNCENRSEGKICGVCNNCLNSELTTLEKANTWLQENNVTVIYPLAEPIRTPLTAEEIAEIEKLHTFYPITNISNDFDCVMSVKYYCDSKNYIDKKISELATAMVNNI